MTLKGKKKAETKRKEKREENGRKKEERKILFSLMKGLAAAFGITCILLIGCGILLTYTSLSEERVPLISLGCTAVSAAAAGFDWAAVMKKRGIFWGTLAGVCYLVLLFLVTGAAGAGFVPKASFWMSLSVAAAAGGAFGIVGVNRKK